jgi:hypothetical protein
MGNNDNNNNKIKKKLGIDLFVLSLPIHISFF